VSINEAIARAIMTGKTQTIGRASVSYQDRTFGISAPGVSRATRNRARAADLLATIA
jgi:hypothetical protein